MKTTTNPMKAAAAGVLACALSALSIPMAIQPLHAATPPSFTKITSGPLVEDVGSICAAAWGDLDGDGFPDVYVARYNTPNQLYRNNGDGTFDRIPFETSVALSAWVVSASFADADNDGDLDLAAGGPGLFLNDGAGNFTLSEGMVSDALRVSGNNTNVGGVSWADYDNDGLLDLVIGGWHYSSPGPPNSLFHNEGQGAFSATAGPVTTDLGPSVGMSWADFDMDGDLDLFVVNMFRESSGHPNFLYRNDGGGAFVRLTGSEAGPVATDSLAEISGSWADYDNDGDLDLFVSGFGHASSLYKNLLSETGEAMFVRVIGALFAFAESVSADAGVWGDYDNDGFLDLFVSNGLYTGAAANYLFRNNGDGSFTRVTDASPVSELQPTASPAWIDYDNDGFLDLFGNTGPLIYTSGNWTSYLFRNEGNSNHWLKVKCVGAAGPNQTTNGPIGVSNRDGIGAKLWLTATIRGQDMRQLREISSGSGRGGSTPLEAHFGLGDATTATMLRIEWPSGKVTELDNVAADQRLIVTEPPPGPWLTNPSIVGGKLQFTLVGEMGSSIRIQRSTNLEDWEDWETLTQGEAPVDLSDPEAATNGARFYRAITP